MRFPTLIGEAARRLPTIGQTHWFKAALAMNRFGDRYPHWSDETLLKALARTAWTTTPQVSGLLHPMVTGPAFEVNARRTRAIIARSLFPLSYLIGRRWYDQVGLAEMVLEFKSRAIHEGSYLGHGWTVWCSFLEVAPLLAEETDRLFTLERFVEFVAKEFPGYPSFNSQWQPPLQADPGDQDPSAVLDACLERPGFFGHHLLTLGYLHRHKSLLSDLEWRVGLAQAQRMTELDYADEEDNVIVPASAVPEAPVGDADLEAAMLGLILKGPRNEHSLTLADIAYDLWQVAGERQRRHLIHYLKSFVVEA